MFLRRKGVESSASCFAREITLRASTMVVVVGFHDRIGVLRRATSKLVSSPRGTTRMGKSVSRRGIAKHGRGCAVGSSFRYCSQTMCVHREPTAAGRVTTGKSLCGRNVTNLVVVVVVDIHREVGIGFRLVLLSPVWHEQLHGYERDVDHGSYETHPDATGTVGRHAVRRQRQVVLPAPA